MKTVLFILFVAFSSCTNRFTEVSIFSSLQEGDSVSVALYSNSIADYFAAGNVTVSSIDAARGRVDISLPDSTILNTPAILLTIHCYSDSILTISSIRLKNYRKLYPFDIVHGLWLQQGLSFDIDQKSNSLTSPVSKEVPGVFAFNIVYVPKYFYPAGLQFFYRLLFLGVILIFSLIMCKQAATCRLQMFSIAIFISSIPLINIFTDYAIYLLIIATIITFFYNKPRCFAWQPIFYVLCGIYLSKAIGTLYSLDFDTGMQRLDRGLALILMPFIVSMFRLPRNNVMLVLRFTLWWVIAFCVFALVSYAAIVPEFTWNMAFRDSKLFAGWLLLWPAHRHPSFVSVILLISIPIALFLRYHDDKQITFIEMFAGVLLPIFFAILAGARVGMVIAPALLGLGYLFYCKFKPALKWGFLVAGIVAAGFMIHSLPEVRQRFLDPIRVDLRRTAISAIKEKPIFGWGTGSSLSLMQSEERSQRLEIENIHYFHAFHNQFLDDMIDAGFFGIAILITLFLWMFWIGLREKHFLLLSLFTMYFIFCFVDIPLFSRKGTIPFAFWFCFFLTNSHYFSKLDLSGRIPSKAS